MPFKDHDLNRTLKNVYQTNNEVELILRDYFLSKNPMFMVSQKGWTPNIDVYETSDGYVVKAELAGVKKEHVTIEIDQQKLIISGKRDDVFERKREHCHLAEISYGMFMRQIELPEDFDGNQIKAKFGDGYLNIVIPKTEKSNSEPYMIPISD